MTVWNPYVLVGSVYDKPFRFQPTEVFFGVYDEFQRNVFIILNGLVVFACLIL